MRTPPNERLTSDIAGTPKARKASEPEQQEAADADSDQ